MTEIVFHSEAAARWYDQLLLVEDLRRRAGAGDAEAAAQVDAAQAQLDRMGPDSVPDAPVAGDA